MRFAIEILLPLLRAGAVFFLSGNVGARSHSGKQTKNRSSPAAERKVMTMVAERTQFANRNMRQDRKVGKESV